MPMNGIAGSYGIQFLLFWANSILLSTVAAVLISVQLLSCVQLFATPWTAAHQASLFITNSWSLLKLMSIKLVIPSNHLILSSLSPPAFKLSQHRGLFQWVSSLHQVAKVLELQHQSWLVGSPCSPRDSQEFSPMPQFKSINSLTFSLLYGPTLPSIHVHWKTHSFDYMNLCQQSYVSFQLTGKQWPMK